jgi:Stress responsive A/B Barrel Domain
MNKRLACAAAAVTILAGLFAVATRERAEAAKQEGAMLVHNVYFSLKDNSPENRKKLVDACKKYLTKHDGEVFFAAGPRAEELNRPINDQEFDVSLNIVFKNKEAHDKYQEAPRHKQFIEENKDDWKKVRVFDSTAEK